MPAQGTSEIGLLILLMQRSVGCYAFGRVLSHFYMQLGKSGSALTIQTGSRDQIMGNSMVKIEHKRPFIHKPAVLLSLMDHRSFSWEMFEDMLVERRRRTNPDHEFTTPA
jgi:hypothetical protein